MQRRGGVIGRALTFIALVALAAGPIHAAGFSIFEQGTKAMGMAGAFTAQADDPSMLFHNAGGLAFVTQRQFSLGTTYIKGTKADFQGAAPFPGPGVREEGVLLSEFPPHAYWVQPINNTWKFGLGIETPFGLVTEWKNPNQYSGRFLSTKAAIETFDVNPTLGWQVTPNFGIGIGGIARFAKVELNRHVPLINPFTQTAVDVAALKLDADFSEGYGFNVGLLHKVNNSFSWGLSYRSQISVDMEGDARLTQISTGNAQVDALVASRLPFNSNVPVETTIDYPDSASLGLAFGLSPNLLLETDVNWTGWSSFKEVPITFTNGALPSQVLPEQWDDAFNYRAGLRWTTSPSAQWRFGYVFDETPQPEEGMSPLLPDADRQGLTLGFGHTGGFGYDLAVMYLDFKERTRNQSFPGEGPYFGTYKTKALLFGLTLNF
jgi:long-chain fatty acid transport protein